MSEPSNIRINPFVGDGGTTTYINLTETHIIPSVSPYVIRLNEVPEKQDPSNIRAVWVDSSTGAVTASALTEVAATPAAGEFRPDYATKADGNDNWNTGLIEFSAVDAGKIVQISYTGMGTLAAVQSNKYPSWYTDRGDGSDGDFIPEEDCDISGVKNYKKVFIQTGVTVKSAYGVIIKAADSVIINGTIDASGTAGGPAGIHQGAAGGYFGGGGGGGGNTSGRQDGENGLDGSGGGEGGKGSNKILGEGNGGEGGLGGTSLSAINAGYTNYGSGGGGGGGGGNICLIACNVINNGVVESNGGTGGNGAVNGENGEILIKQLGGL